MKKKNSLAIINNNIEVLSKIENSYITQNEIFAFLKRMHDKNVESANNLLIAFDILTFKHDERNPFPSHELIAERQGVQVRSITNAVSSLVKKGLFINEKGKYDGMDKRKNTYDVTPLLNLFGCFIEKFRESMQVNVQELYEMAVRGNMKASRVSEKKNEEKSAIDYTSTLVFSETVQSELDKLDDKKRGIFSDVISKNVDRLDDETILFYIHKVIDTCKNENTLHGYAFTVFKNANNGDKERHEAKLIKQEEDKIQQAKENELKNKSKARKSNGRKEILPEWAIDTQLKDDFIKTVNVHGMTQQLEEETGIVFSNDKPLDYLKENASKVEAWKAEKSVGWSSFEEYANDFHKKAKLEFDKVMEELRVSRQKRGV